MKYYRKLFITYLAIIILYTAIAVGLFFNQVNIANKDFISSTNEEILMQYKNRTDLNYRIAKNWIKNLITDEAVKRFAVDRANGYINVIDLFQNLQKNMIAFSDASFSVGIVKPGYNSVITPDGTETLARFYNEWNINSTQVVEIEEALNNNEELSSHIIIKSTNQDTQKDSIIYVTKQNIDQENYIAIFIKLNETDTAKNREDGFYDGFYIGYKDKIVDYGDSGLDIMDKALSEASSKFENKNMDPDVVYNYETNQYYIYCVKSNIMQWRYYYVIDKSFMLNRYRDLLIKSLVIYLLLLVVGLAIVQLIVKYIYKPVESVVSLYNTQDGKTQRDEFKFISEQILRNKDTLKIKFITDLIHGTLEKKKIHQGLERYELDFLNAPFFIGLIKILPGTYKDDQTILMVRNNLENWMMDFCVSESSIEILDYAYDMIVVIAHQQHKNQIQQLMKSLGEDTVINLDHKLYLSLSSIYNKTSELVDSFYEAKRNLEYGVFFNDGHVITSHEIDMLDYDNYYYPIDEEKRLMNMVSACDQNGVNVFFEYLLNENYKKRTLSAEKQSQFILAIVATMNRIMQHNGIELSKNTSIDKMTYMDLKLERDYKQLKIKIIDMFQEVIHQIEGNRLKNDGDMGMKMQLFIEENYMHDIALEDLAQEMNITAGYAGVLFKNKVNANFKDYLNQYRVNQAKKMIESDKKIAMKEIAMQVGCSNPNTFLRIFKKYEGISPTMYKEKVNKEKGEK
ncbi:helix-turn-helix domain-containing protein [Vallitaleaceae bacterium 9-2]